MAKRKEDYLPPAKRARPGPEGVSDEEKQMVVVSQTVSPKNAAPQLAPVQMGTIESIHLENFMGYAVLGPVQFGPNVNFVMGSGGKNALLTALIVGLGGKSLGLSLTEFVKDKEAPAKISITLSNRGEKAFKAEVYGDSITVQQYIGVDGAASYELKSQVGNVVSCEEEELTAILGKFKLKVDNPMSILPQDMVRHLLRIRNDGDRYKWFLKVTGLEQMRDEYLRILRKKTVNQEEIEEVQQQLDSLRREGVDIEEHFQVMYTLRKKLQALKQEKSWALVGETERRISDIINNINIGSQHAALLNHDLEVSRYTFQEILLRYVTIQDNVLKLNEEASILEPQCFEAKEDAKRKDRAYREAIAFYNYSQNELSKLDKASEELDDKIEDLKQSLEQAELEKQKKISTLKEKIDHFKDQEELLVREIKYLHQSIEKEDEEHSRIREEESFVQEVLIEDQRQINQLKDYKSEPIKRFGPQILALLEAIDDAYKQGYFSYKPIGPLGACIRLRDPEYALAVESCLKDLLLDFFCDNHKDEQVLQELMKGFYPVGAPRPGVIVSSFSCELYDVTDRAAYHPEYPTVLTALEIDHAVVANALIDLKGIETVLLIKSSSFTDTVIHAHRPPKNCRKFLTTCGDQVFEGRYYSCKDLRPLYLGDVEIEINHLEREVEAKMTKLSAFQELVASLKNDIRKNEETIDSHYRHLREIKDRVVAITSEIKDLEEEEEYQSIDLSILEDEAHEVKEDIKEVEEKIRTRREEMESLKQPKIDAEQRHEEFKLKCHQILALLDSLIEERNKTTLEFDSQHQSLILCKNRLEEQLDILHARREELAFTERELEKEIAQAHYIYPYRIEVTRTSASLSREMDIVIHRIQSENYTNRTQEDIVRQYQSAKQNYLDTNSKMHNLKRISETLDEILTQRYDMFQRNKKNLSTQCQSYFENLLSQWSLSGEMQFDHNNETLSITIHPNEATYSTGSYSTSRLCFSNFVFILSLWSVTESPFRCLDTFDIYMDRKSRKIAMDMVLNIAHSQQDRQMILLSPQHMSSIPTSPLIEILKMPDLDYVKKTVLPFKSVNPEEEEED